MIVTQVSNIRQPLKMRSKQPNSSSDTHTHTPLSDQDNNMTRDIVILRSPPKNLRILVRKTKKSIGEVSRTNKIFRQQLRKHDHIHGCNLLTSDSTSDTTISSCCWFHSTDQLENRTTVQRWAARRCRLIYHGFTFFHLIFHEILPALCAAKGFVTPVIYETKDTWH